MRSKLVTKNIYFKNYISEDQAGINDMLVNCLNVSLHSNNPDKAIRNGEFLMTADCGTGKTAVIAQDIFEKTHSNHINIMASPNVAQVIQNNAKYRLRAVIGKNHLAKIIESPVGSNVIYDKLLDEIRKIDAHQLKDVILVIDEAHQLVDAEYRKDVLSDVKLACKKVVNAGGRVIYLTATPLHIELAPPDNNPACPLYAAHIKCSKVDTVGAIVRNRNYNRIDVKVFDNINNFPIEVAKQVENGKYFLIQNNDKDYNLHMVRYFEQQGISAIAISADDTNFSVSSKEYDNDAYNDIVLNSQINLGPYGVGYQVILTTCLLNNGTSIDQLYYEDEEVRRNTECVYVCNTTGDFNLSQIEQFFVRVRYNHIENQVFIPKKLIKNIDVKMKSYEDVLDGFIYGAENGAYVNKNLCYLSKKADEAYCKSLCSNEESLRKGLEQFFLAPAIISHNELGYNNGIYEIGDWKYTEEEIENICELIEAVAQKPIEFYRFCNWDVNTDGKNEVREAIKAVDPVLAKYIATTLTLYHGGTGLFDVTAYNADIRKVFELADRNYKDVRKSFKELERNYVKLFFFMAADNKLIKTAIQNYAVTNCSLSGKADIRTMISAIARDDGRDILVVNKDDVNVLKRAFQYKYLQKIFSERLVKDWLTLFSNTVDQGYGSAISWERLCKIGTTFTSDNITWLSSYIQVNKYMKGHTVNNENLRICQMASELVSADFAGLFGVSLDWTNAKITYDKCTDAAQMLRNVMKTKYHYTIKRSDDSLRRLILRLYGFMFTYKKVPAEITITRKNGRNITTTGIYLYLFDKRKSADSLDPLYLTFTNKEKDNAVSAFSDLEEIFGSGEDFLEIKERSKFEKYITEDILGINSYDTNAINKDGLVLDVERFRTVLASVNKDLYGKNIVKGVASYISDMSGVYIGGFHTSAEAMAIHGNAKAILSSLKSNLVRIVLPIDTDVVFDVDDSISAYEHSKLAELLER